jgi:hypothetical protein
MKLPISADDQTRKEAEVVARTLLSSAQPGTFEVVWPAIQSDEEFGKGVLLDFADEPIPDMPAVFTSLNEDQLGKLFVWLEERFPRASDPTHGAGAHSMEPRDSVAQFRDGVLQALVVRGTIKAVESLRRVQAALPHLNWIYVHVLNAEANMMRATWTPPTPSDVLAIVRDSRLRLISNARELVDVAIESLER